MRKRYLPFLVLLLAGCSLLQGPPSADNAVEMNKEDSTEQFEVAMPKGGEVSDEQHGSEVWFAIGAISGIKNMPANGVAQAHYFEDGNYLQNLKVNIESAEKGFFYEGWIVPPESGEWVSLGHLGNHFGDARHGVQFRADRDYRGFLKVKVTKEADDGNPAPGLTVAEGLLKVTER